MSADDEGAFKSVGGKMLYLFTLHIALSIHGLLHREDH
jgi:hypothetical protein